MSANTDPKAAPGSPAPGFAPGGEADLARRLFEASPVLMVVLAADGTIAHVNPAFERLTGHALADVRGREWFATMLPERDRDRIRARFRAATGGTPTRGHVNPILTRAGEEREIEWHDQVLAGGEDPAHALLAIGLDVTERMRAERALRESESRLRAIVDSEPECVKVVDRDGRLLEMNPAGLAMIRAPAGASAGGRNVVELLPPEHRQAYRDGLAAVFRGESHRLAFEMVTLDGERRWMEQHAAPLRDPDDPSRVVAMLAVARDITDRVGMEAALRDANARLEERVSERTRELSERSRVQQALLDNLPEALRAFDHAHTVVYTNARYHELFDIDREAMLAAPDPVLYPTLVLAARGEYGPGELEEVARRRFEAVTRGRTSFQYERRRPNGQWLEVRGAPIAGWGWVLLSRDITERKARETEIARQATLLESILANLNDGLMITDAGGTIVACNEAAARITGADPALMRPGGTVREVILAQARAGELGTEDPEGEAERRLRQFGSGERVVLERVRRGTSFELRRSPIPGGGTITIYVDTSRRRQAEESLRRLNEDLEAEVARRSAALAESEARYASLVANINDALFRDDVEGRLVYANPRFVEWFGLAGRDLREVALEDYVAPEWRERIRDRHDRRVRGEDVPQRYEFEGVRAGGERLWLEATVSPVIEAGRIVGTQSVLRDVTEQKRAEGEVRRLAAELEARVHTRTAELADALEELESFSYSISHDLRSPLRAMSGFSGLVIEEYGDRLPDEGRRMLGRISDAATTMSELIDGLLALAQIGRHPLNRRRTDLTRIAREVWAEIAAAHPQRAIAFEAIGECPADCDPILLRSVLQNLLGNAFKYTRGRTDAAVAFGCEGAGAESTYFVRDNGVGFDPAYADKLFRPFQRLHAAGEFEGTGIGLATVRRVVQRHGGRIWAESSPGGGAVFRFTLGVQAP